MTQYNTVKLLQDYTNKNATFLHSFGSYNPLGSVGTLLGRQTIRLADKYLFTPSAINMHQTVYVPDMLLVPRENNTWIHLHQPLEHTYKVAALFVYNRAASSEIDIVIPHSILDQNARMHEQFNKFKPFWFLHLVDETGNIVCKYSYKIDVTEWAFFFDHICPFGLCKISDEIKDNLTVAKYTSYIACEHCQETTEYWTTWLHTALRMINLDFATSPTPEDFNTVIMKHTDKQLVERHHGKGKPKEKQVTTEIPFKVVTYDVSTIAIDRPDTTSTIPGDKRTNWLTLHGKEDRIYKRVYPHDRDRTYQGTYFKKLIQRCIAGNTLVPGQEYSITVEQKEYTVTVDEIGQVAVIGKVSYPEGVYIPMLKPELKQQVIRRVTATRFIQ